MQMTKSHQKNESAPEKTEPGQQKDDNIDDLGRRPDGTRLDQPVDPGKPRPAKSANAQSAPDSE
jgi:hypothetical protein